MTFIKAPNATDTVTDTVAAYLDLLAQSPALSLAVGVGVVLVSCAFFNACTGARFK